MIQTEKINLEAPDTVRIHVYSDDKKGLKEVTAELVKTTVFPAVSLSATDPLASAKKTPGLEVLSKTKGKKQSSKDSKKFTSKVSEKYPASTNNSTQTGLIMDDKAQMPEATRQVDQLIELSIPKETESTFSADGVQINYFTLVCCDVCCFYIISRNERIFTNN